MRRDGSAASRTPLVFTLVVCVLGLESLHAGARSCACSSALAQSCVLARPPQAPVLGEGNWTRVAQRLPAGPARPALGPRSRDGTLGSRLSVRPSTLAAASSHLTCGARCTERDGLRADGSFRGCFPAAASAEMPRNSGQAHLRFRPHPAAPSSPCSSGPSLARASGFIN